MSGKRNTLPSGQNVAWNRLEEAQRVVEAWQDCQARTEQSVASALESGNLAALRHYRARDRRAREQLQTALAHLDYAEAIWIRENPGGSRGLSRRAV